MAGVSALLHQGGISLHKAGSAISRGLLGSGIATLVVAPIL